MTALALVTNSICQTHPTIAAQWHPARNGDLTPEMVTYGSAKKVWWLGECGHEWKSMVANRTSGSGCPMCAHRKRSTRNIAGTLDSTHPDLAAQWHPKKNEGLAPSDVSYGSGKKVWWLGDCGHSWQAAISNRVRSVSRVCPRCSDNRKSTRNLKDTHPDIAKQWHPDKNKDLTPEDVSHGSGKKVWWLGDCGHKWKAEIRNRARGAGCPVCSGLQVLVGFNDLASTDPHTAQWWNTAKNGDVRPTDVTRRSAKKVWWKCPNGHEWKRSVSAMRAAGCPKCDHTRC